MVRRPRLRPRPRVRPLLKNFHSLSTLFLLGHGPGLHVRDYLCLGPCIHFQYPAISHQYDSQVDQISEIRVCITDKIADQKQGNSRNIKKKKYNLQYNLLPFLYDTPASVAAYKKLRNQDLTTAKPQQLKYQAPMVVQELIPIRAVSALQPPKAAPCNLLEYSSLNRLLSSCASAHICFLRALAASKHSIASASAGSFLYGDLTQYVEGAVLSKSFVSRDNAAAIDASGVLLVVRSLNPDF
ncbi:hypothetical protein C4D60_Mb08t27430 [Musa balbisiana]|uniref:Uncharacterized protein n=1 Tax=Musa balbisiana TaxID=52838 RepID=A0A4S8K6W9_MUSBA|nr:hypothetical protein C4D60_Mb08t27430 [Musa balbisiana]